jgi:uncharacterized protein YwgA/O-acetyl-ADP-ribose deacetylase (regulator of RNase III)
MSAPLVKVLIGDIFRSDGQTLVNTVNMVGVMGKGIALGFRKHFPEMYEDYVRRCAKHEVRLGRPYLYRRAIPPNIVNFPTKDHWRSVSRLSDIVEGLKYLEAHIHEWGVTSLAVPPLGCGEGQLEWRVVGKTLYRHLVRLNIPVQLFAPFGTPDEEMRPEFLEESAVAASGAGHHNGNGSKPTFRIEPGWLALVAILDRINQERYRWPIGRVGFQKVAYFATEAGIPTKLVHERKSYGPYALQMKQVLSRLTNNGLIVEQKLGRMLSTTIGPTYQDARRAYEDYLNEWQPKIDAVADLLVRMSTNDAEIAATVHFAAKQIGLQKGRKPTEIEVLQYVMDWKKRRRPPLNEAEVALAIRRLNVLGWLDAEPSKDLPVSEDLMIA